MQDTNQDDLLALEAEFGQALDEGGDFSAALTKDDDSQSDTGGDAGAASQAAAQQQGAEANQSTDGGAAADTGDQSQGDKGTTTGTKGEEQASPDGVLTKDGKNFIPYRVLEETRKRAAEAEQRIAQLEQDAQGKTQAEQELERLRQQLSSQAEAQGETVNEEGDPLEGLNEEDYPADLVKAIKWQHQQLTDANAAIKELRQERQQREASEKQQAANTVQQAIDANPDLSAWQAENGDLWKAAVAHDERLRQSPHWSGKPVQERFAKAVQLTKTEFDLQDTKPPSGVGDQAGNAGAKAQSSHDDTPAGISDIPGGSTPSQSSDQAEDDMSPQALAAKMENLSNEQVDQMLSRYG